MYRIHWEQNYTGTCISLPLPLYCFLLFVDRNTQGQTFVKKNPNPQSHFYFMPCSFIFYFQHIWELTEKKVREKVYMYRLCIGNSVCDAVGEKKKGKSTFWQLDQGYTFIGKRKYHNKIQIKCYTTLSKHFLL